jgi:hypothetical protein
VYLVYFVVPLLPGNGYPERWGKILRISLKDFFFKAVMQVGREALAWFGMFRGWGFKETLHVPLSGWAAAWNSGQQPICFSG